MASGFGVPSFMKKYQPVKYVARYKCSVCKESWKVRNSSAQPKNCEGTGCSQVVFPYEKEPIDQLVIYECPQCKTVVKEKRCKSEISDEPYCRICQCNMKRIPKRMYGIFQCPCSNHWGSGYSWEGKGQDCKRCGRLVYPELRPLRRVRNDNSRAEHDETRCEMCKTVKKMGYANCKSYKSEDTPVEGDNSEDDEDIPDDQSVITVNSDVSSIRDVSRSPVPSSGSITPTEEHEDDLDIPVEGLLNLKLNN